MNITHPEMVAALVKPGDVIADEMTPIEADLWHGATGVAGETTEILEAAISAVVTGTLDRANMIEELGDMEFYLEQVRQNRGITRDEVMAHDGEKHFGTDIIGNAACLAVAGGAVLDLAKKVSIYKKDVEKDAFVKALSYVEGCMNLIRVALQITREETLDGNIAKLSVRYAGLKYSNEAAQTRADKAEGE